MPVAFTRQTGSPNSALSVDQGLGDRETDWLARQVEIPRLDAVATGLCRWLTGRATCFAELLVPGRLQLVRVLWLKQLHVISAGAAAIVAGPNLRRATADNQRVRSRPYIPIASRCAFIGDQHEEFDRSTGRVRRLLDLGGDLNIGIRTVRTRRRAGTRRTTGTRARGGYRTT